MPNQRKTIEELKFIKRLLFMNRFSSMISGQIFTSAEVPAYRAESEIVLGTDRPWSKPTIPDHYKNDLMSVILQLGL